MTINNSFNTTQIGTDGGGILGPFAGISSGTINVTDCYNTGLVGNNGGGIVGRESGTSGGTVTVTNCYNSGILSSQSGGIFGVGCANAGNTFATNCYNTGTSGATVGGIYGGNSSRNEGTATATTCYNNGAFTGTNSGGIFCNLSGDGISTSYAYYCWNQVPISSGSGGIFAFNTVRGVAVGCYNTGNIGTSGGGIFGNRCQGGNCQAIECYNTGTIGSNAGGIFGEQTCLNNSGTASATNCYNTNSIGNQGGGICGNNCFNCTVTSCYSSGSIGSLAGGIFGNTARDSTAINCYSTQSIPSDGGGIYGRNPTSSSATNCFSLGTFSNNNGIFAPTQSGSSITNCYSANGSWSSATARTLLTGNPTYNVENQLVKPVGESWLAPSSNNSTPWLFPTLGYSPYTTVKTNTYTQTLKLNVPTNPALDPTGHTYSIVSINDLTPSNFSWISINQSTGSINTTMAGYIGLFRIKVMQNSDYSITNFELNINVRCFFEKTKILCLNTITNTEEWVEIKDIKKGMMVKTLNHGYVKVLENSCVQLLNTVYSTKHKLYVLRKGVGKYKDLFEDLYVSGLHSILLDDDELSPNVKLSISKYKSVRCVEGKKAIMAWLNDEFEEVNDTNVYNLYQLILESKNLKQQYAIYSNGILSETISIWTWLCSQDKGTK